MNKIAIIIPWYGKIPNYLPLFLKGLELNVSVLDVLFYTDAIIPVDYKIPNNFKVIPLSWQQLVQKLKDKVGEEVNINSPYKLCDYKPMYGSVFEEDLVDYTFWGYGDIDLIYGDLSRFMPFDGIDNYDVLTFRENIMHGPFCIIRNNPYLNSLYRKTNNLARVIASPDHVAFDETGKVKPWRTRARVYTFIHLDDFWDWTSIVQYEADKGNLKLFERYYCIECIHSDSILFFENGKLLLGREEFAFFHWVWHKTLEEFILPNWIVAPDSFFIHRTGFYAKKSKLFLLIQRYRTYKAPLVKLMNRLRASYNYRFKKCFDK